MWVPGQPFPQASHTDGKAGAESPGGPWSRGAAAFRNDSSGIPSPSAWLQASGKSPRVLSDKRVSCTDSRAGATEHERGSVCTHVHTCVYVRVCACVCVILIRYLREPERGEDAELSSFLTSSERLKTCGCSFTKKASLKSCTFLEAWPYSLPVPDNLSVIRPSARRLTIVRCNWSHRPEPRAWAPGRWQ